MPKTMWSPVEQKNESGDTVAVHIMPIVAANNHFETREACESFVESLREAEFPCLSDDGGDIRYTFFGHTLKQDCSCRPDVNNDHVPPMYTHRMTQ